MPAALPEDVLQLVLEIDGHPQSAILNLNYGSVAELLNG